MYAVHILETGWDQERVDLGLRKKVTLYLTPEKVYKFEVLMDKDINWQLKGAIKTIAKVQKIQDLKKQGVKVVFKTIQNTELSASHHSQNVLRRSTFTRNIQ